MTEKQLVLRKITEISNGPAKFMVAEIKNVPGEYGLIATQSGLLNQRIVLRCNHVTLVTWLRAALADLGEL